MRSVLEIPGKDERKSQKEGIEHRESGRMLPEEMMKPKNKCQREEGRRGGVEGGGVKLCQSLAASDGSGNKRINEGMKEENAAWRRRGGERRPAGRDAEGAQAARWRDERHVSGVPLLHLSIPPSLPHPSPPSFFLRRLSFP